MTKTNDEISTNPIVSDTKSATGATSEARKLTDNRATSDANSIVPDTKGNSGATAEAPKMTNEKVSSDTNPIVPETRPDSGATAEAPKVAAEKSPPAPSSAAAKFGETKPLAQMPDAQSRDGKAPAPREHSSDLYRTHLMERENILHRMLSVPQTRELKAPGELKRVTLTLRGMTEIIMLTEDRVVILGRADLRLDGFKPDVDLTPYGARERGVSRAHVRLHVRDNKLYLTDLYSANGTFMGNEKLVAEKPYELHNGDELLLGALSIKVEIE